MRIIAVRGPDFLIDIEHRPEGGMPQGVVYSASTGRAYPPASIASIVGRGYWIDSAMDMPNEVREAVLKVL
jgi:hypothetical protein